MNAGATPPHPLYALITEMVEDLDAVTQMYCTTGKTLVSLEHTQRGHARRRDHEHEIAAAAMLNDPTLGTNEKQRAANLALRLAVHGPLHQAREALIDAEDACKRTERLHKNAYHEMDSLKVCLAALTALVQGGEAIHG